MYLWRKIKTLFFSPFVSSRTFFSSDILKFSCKIIINIYIISHFYCQNINPTKVVKSLDAKPTRHLSLSAFYQYRSLTMPQPVNFQLLRKEGGGGGEWFVRILFLECCLPFKVVIFVVRQNCLRQGRSNSKN